MKEERSHYPLLAHAMAKTGRGALAELVTRGKEQLVLIRIPRRPYDAYDVLCERGA
jgi:non-homologous end joining protein Ku